MINLAAGGRRSSDSIRAPRSNGVEGSDATPQQGFGGFVMPAHAGEMKGRLIVHVAGVDVQGRAVRFRPVSEMLSGRRFVIIFSRDEATLYEGVSVRPSVRPSVGWSVTCFFFLAY